jgi:16S rRNA (guanine527-N7)-methyltransferase
MKSLNPIEIAWAVRAIVAEELALHSYRPAPNLLARIETFAATLALWGSKLNLTSAPDDADEIAFHVIDSLVPLFALNCSKFAGLAEGFASGSRVLDLGSGAGFPALLLAAATDAEFVLLEARRKRASFLSVAAAEMGLANVRVDSSRAELMTMEPAFDLVTARAFAEPSIVFKTASASLKPGGSVILYANPSQRSAIEVACVDAFQPAVFLDYEVPRGSQRVAHMLAIAQPRTAVKAS